eukprot:gene28840-37847_t
MDSIVVSSSKLPGSFRELYSPLKLDLPVWSLSTLNDDFSTTNMNIVTYATQVGIKPLPVYAISLFKGTLSFDNFKRNGYGALQLLPSSAHNLVNCLGKRSGRDFDKVTELQYLGVSLSAISIPSSRSLSLVDQSTTATETREDSLLVINQSPMILLVEYLRQEYPILDVRDHEVMLCQVNRVISFSDTEQKNSSEGSYLTTQTLRNMNII